MLLIFISFFKFDPCRLLQKLTSLLRIQITFLAVEVKGVVLLFSNCSNVFEMDIIYYFRNRKKGGTEKKLLAN